MKKNLPVIILLATLLFTAPLFSQHNRITASKGKGSDRALNKYKRQGKAFEYYMERQKWIEKRIASIENELINLKKERIENRKKLNEEIDLKIKQKNDQISRIKEEQVELKKIKSIPAEKKVIKKQSKDDGSSESISQEIDELKDLKKETSKK